MSIRSLTPMLALTLACTLVSARADAKPPDLPAGNKVNCQEQPGVRSHDGACVPTQAGYVPGGCIQLQEEQEAQLFEECEPAPVIDSMCPGLGEVIRTWIECFQQCFETPGPNVAGARQASRAASVVAFYPPMNFFTPVVFGAGEEAKKCKCGNGCECMNCTEECCCEQPPAVSEEELIKHVQKLREQGRTLIKCVSWEGSEASEATCACSKNCDCMGDCKCCKGNKCSDTCTCGTTAKNCACSNNCKCASGCECCEGKACNTECSCSKTTVCCPAQGVMVVIVKNLKDSIRESSCTVEVIDAKKIRNAACGSCRQGVRCFRKVMNACVKKMSKNMGQAVRQACGGYEGCEDRTLPCKKIKNTTISCPFLIKKEALKEAKKKPAQRDHLAVSVLDNLEKLKEAKRLVKQAEELESAGHVNAAAWMYEQVKDLCPGSRFDAIASERIVAIKVGDSHIIGLTEPQEPVDSADAKLVELVDGCRQAIKEKRWSDARNLADRLSLALDTLFNEVPAPPAIIYEEEAEPIEFMPLDIEQLDGVQSLEIRDVEEQVAELLEACQRALANGQLEEARSLAQEAQMLDPDCVAAHALVYKTHLLIQIDDELRKEAEKEEQKRIDARPEDGAPVIFGLELPPIDPGIIDALGQIEIQESNWRPRGGVEEAEFTQEAVPCEELEDYWPDICDEPDPCEQFIEEEGNSAVTDDPCEDCECKVKLGDLVDVLKQCSCVEIDIQPETGWRLQCQVYIGATTYSLYASDEGGVRCVMVSGDVN